MSPNIIHVHASNTISQYSSMYNITMIMFMLLTVALGHKGLPMIVYLNSDHGIMSCSHTWQMLGGPHAAFEVSLFQNH